MGLLVLVRTHAEMLDGLTGVPLAAEQDGVRPGGRAESELVEGQDLTAGLEDALLGRLGEPEGGDGELRNFQKTDIIRHGTDSDDDLGIAVGRALGLLNDAREGKGGTVRLGEEKTVEERLHMPSGKFLLESPRRRIGPC